MWGNVWRHLCQPAIAALTIGPMAPPQPRQALADHVPCRHALAAQTPEAHAMSYGPHDVVDPSPVTVTALIFLISADTTDVA